MSFSLSNNIFTLADLEFENMTLICNGIKKVVVSFSKAELSSFVKGLLEYEKFFKDISEDENTIEDIKRRDSIMSSFEKKWRTNKRLKMNEVEQEAYREYFISSTGSYHIYGSWVRLGDKPLLKLTFSGDGSYAFNIRSEDVWLEYTQHDLVSSLINIIGVGLRE